jgi:hypothetical protein
MARLQTDQGSKGAVAERLRVDDLGCDDGLFRAVLARVFACVEIPSIK